MYGKFRIQAVLVQEYNFLYMACPHELCSKGRKNCVCGVFMLNMKNHHKQQLKFLKLQCRFMFMGMPKAVCPVHHFSQTAHHKKKACTENVPLGEAIPRK
jgi:hypothetical protein